MFRPLSVFIGTRYTRAKRRSHFVSFISLTSMIGLALGVLVMIVVLSVMNGFDREMRTRILGMVPQATVESYQPIDDWRALAEKVKAHEHVTAVAPFTQMQGMLSANGAVQTVMVDAVDPLEEAKVSIIPDFFKQLDGGLSLIHLEDAARLQRWKTNQVQGLRLKLDDLFQAPRVAWEIARTLTDNDFYARDWTRSHGNLYQAIRMEKTMIGLLLLLIVAVAAFNIISTLVMVVTDKKSDIAILRTLGATPGQIMATFMVQGTVIGVIGTLVGGVLGVVAALNVSAWISALEKLLGHQFLASDVYFIDYLPSQLMLDDVVLVCGAALVLSFFATLYPAWRAARTQPAEALRYE